jgi:hypothetical protein
MYVNTPVYRAEGEVVFGLRQPAMFPGSSDLMVNVPLQLEGRLDLVSNTLYGSPDFWWAIADLNALVDPFLVEAGTTLRTGPRQNLPT